MNDNLDLKNEIQWKVKEGEGQPGLCMHTDFPVSFQGNMRLPQRRLDTGPWTLAPCVGWSWAVCSAGLVRVSRRCLAGSVSVARWHGIRSRKKFRFLVLSGAGGPALGLCV